MPAITLAQLENAALDAAHLAEIAISSAMTSTDRLGQSKKTLAGALYAIGGITNRGAWVTGTEYAIKDIVSDSGTWYVCVVAHAASAAFATDAAKWRVYQGVTTGDLAVIGAAETIGADDGVSGIHWATVQAALNWLKAAINEYGLSIKGVFGALGNGVADDSAAFGLAAVSGIHVRVPDGDYITDPFEITVSGTKIKGDGSVAVTLLIAPTSSVPSIWGLSSDIELSGVTITVSPAAIGEGGGMFSTGFTAGRYFHANAYNPIRRVVLHDVVVLRDDNTNLVNSFTLIGDVADVTVTKCKSVGGLGGVVCHWGADQIGTYGSEITTQTFHPNNIVVDDFEATDSGSWPVFISACYDVTVTNLRVNDCVGAIAVVAGDVGAQHAPAAVADKILTGINIGRVVGNVTGGSALLIDGEGHYTAIAPEDDFWQRVPMDLTIDHVSLYATGGAIAPVAMISDAVGSINIGTLEIRTDDYVCTGLELERSSGVTINRYSTNASNAFNVDRSKGVTVNRVDFAEPQATTDATTNYGINCVGARYTSTLGAALNLLDETMTIATAFAVRVYAGDIIRVSANSSQFVRVTEDYVSATSPATFAIEPADFAVANGTAVMLDNFCDDINVLGGRIKGYPKSLTAVGTTSYHTRNLRMKDVLMESGYLDDVTAQRVDGLEIDNCEFRSGGRQSADTVTDTRAISLTNCRDFRVVRNRIGNEHRWYTDGVWYGDVNSVEGLVADNTFGAGLGITGTDVSAGLKAAGRDNVYDNNRQFGGGVVTPALV